MTYCEADKIESIRRMREIDDLRANGGKTIYEKIIDECGEPYNLPIKISVMNCETKEKNEYGNLKEACKDNGVAYHRLQGELKKSVSKRVLYGKLLFTKMDHMKEKEKVVDFDKHLKSWADEEIAYIVQRRPIVFWKSIAVVIGKTPDACAEKFRNVKRQGKLDYYKNFKLETL